MEHFSIVDDALNAVEAARKTIKKNQSRQVSKGEEIDHMRAVVNTWFTIIRPQLLAHVGVEDLGSIDSPMRRILDATAKLAARTTYLSALDECKASIRRVRSNMPVEIIGVGAASSDDSPPDFSPLARDLRMRGLLVKRWDECVRCLQGQAYLAAVVMMGGLIETLFVSRANLLSDKSALASAKRAPKNRKTGKAIPFQEWTLNHYIEVGHELGWIGNIAKLVSASLRDYRNFVHPQAELARGHSIESQDAMLLWDVTKAITRELLAREQ